LNAASDTARPAAAFSKPDPPPAAPPTLARPPRPSRRRFAPQAGGRYLAPFPAAPPPGGTVGMLLTIETTRTPGGPPATDLGYLLHKNPVRAQTFGMSFGKAHVFYPEADNDRCRAAVLLDVDPVGLVRGKGRPGGSGWGGGGGTLDQYVNDRPYVASSFMSVAIAELFGTAMN